MLCLLVLLAASSCARPDQKSPTPATPVQAAAERIPPGLGVSRAQVLGALAEKQDPFKGEESSPVNGQPRWLGRSEDQLSILELTGPPGNLSRIYLTFGVPKGDLTSAAAGMVRMHVLLKTVFPEWTDANKWIISSIETVTQKGQDKVVEKKEGKRVEFSIYRQLGFFGLSIAPEQ